MAEELEMKRAKAILAGVEAEEAKARRALAKKADWDDPSDVALYRGAVREKERAAVLDAVVPTRVCPGCQKVVPLSRSWVVNKRKTAAVCRSCFAGGFVEGRRPVFLEVFGDCEVRYPIDGAALRLARIASGMSAKRFCYLAGFKTSYLHRMEMGYVLSVSQEAAENLISVFERTRVSIVRGDEDEDEE